MDPEGSLRLVGSMHSMLEDISITEISTNCPLAFVPVLISFQSSSDYFCAVRQKQG